MNRKSVFGGVLLAMAVVALTGCGNNLKAENVLLTEENASLRQQLEDRNAALEAARMEAREKDTQLAQLRRDMNSGGGMMGGTAFDGIPGVSGRLGAGEVTAVVESDVLFDSGKATLKASAKKSLDQVASILNASYAGHKIRVAGHTDIDPIKKSGHKSNYHLGFERAFAVREYLISRGVSQDRIYLASYGPIQPAGSKAQSRRVEIVVALGS